MTTLTAKDFALKTSLYWYNRPMPVAKIRQATFTDSRRQAYKELIKDGSIIITNYHGEQCLEMTEAGLDRLRKVMPKVCDRFTPNKALRNVNEEVTEVVYWMTKVEAHGQQITCHYIADPDEMTQTTDSLDAFTLPAAQWRDVKDYEKRFNLRGTHCRMFPWQLSQLRNYRARKWYR